jgi:hypothetical protein
MNASLTFNSVVFEPALLPSGQTGSFRQSSARGVTTPDTLSIAAQNYTDSKYKQPGVRRLARIGGVYKDANGSSHEIAFQVLGQIPNIASATDVATVLATFKAAVANADFLADVLNNES